MKTFSSISSSHTLKRVPSSLTTTLSRLLPAPEPPSVAQLLSSTAITSKVASLESTHLPRRPSFTVVYTSTCPRVPHCRLCYSLYARSAACSSFVCCCNILLLALAKTQIFATGGGLSMSNRIDPSNSHFMLSFSSRYFTCSLALASMLLGAKFTR